MDKRISQKTSAKMIAAAVASVGLAGFGASKADASMLVDMRVASINTVPVPQDGVANKSIPLGTLNVGDTVVFDVVVRISGTNGVQTVGNFDNATPTTDTRNDDSFQSLVGAFQSVGPLKGNFQGGVNSNQGNSNQANVFGASGAQNGSELDFDSDGDLDLGTTGTDPTNMWVVRAGSPQVPTVSKKGTATRFGTSVANATGGAALFNEDFGGPSANVPNTKVIDANTAEMLVGELTWVMTAGNSATQGATVNFVPRANGDASTALWFEDGVVTGKNPSTSPFALGAPILVGNVPEPTTLGLMGLASLGLLARRKKQS